MNIPRQRFLSPPHRGGFAVAEAVIAATTLSVLAGLGITTVCLLMTAEQRTAEAVVVERTIAQLADELRGDAHTATAAEFVDADGSTALSLRLPDDVHVTYECTPDGVWRREQAGDALLRQEKFHLPFGTSRFEQSSDARLLVWRHEREVPATMGFADAPATTDQPRRTYRITAALHWRTP